MMNGMGGFGLMGLGWLFWIVLLMVIIWAVVRLVNANQSREEFPPERPDDALSVLKKRYARGEISREEYLKMKQDLTS